MKLIGIVLLVGLMIAVIIAATTNQQERHALAATADRPNRTMRADALDRCRAIPGPDAACEAAWRAERDRFFGTARR